MLGRLFAQQSDHGSPTTVAGSSIKNSTIHGPVGSGMTSTSPMSQNNDDVFTRSVLYGSRNYLEPHSYDSSKIRLLILQNNGGYYERNNYLSVFDSYSVESGSKGHNVKEIIPKAFGTQIYQDFDSNEAYKIIKLDEKSMLVSLHFKNKRNFAIVLILPFAQKNFSHCVLPNWKDLKKHLQLVKVSFIRNHLNNPTQNKQSKLTSNFMDIVSIFKQFLKTFSQLLSTPRLMVGLTGKFDSVLFNWCNELNNWVEIKDGGRNHNAGSHFLGSLLTLINDTKEQLINPQDEFLRIVIMTSNPIVSQKLIFIISGLLSYPLDFSVIPHPTKPKKSNLTISIPKYQASISTSAVNATNASSPIPTTATTSDSVQQPSIMNQGWEIPKTPSKSITTPSVLSHSSSFASNLNSVSYLSSSLSNSYSQPTISSSYFSRSFQYLTNWGNISPSLDSNSSSTSIQSTKTPSPALEYEEYPWTDLNNTPHNHTSTNHPPQSHFHHSFSTPSSLQMSRVNSSFELNRRKSKMPLLPKIKRTSSTVFNTNKPVGNNTELLKLMNTSIKDISSLSLNKSKNVSILNVDFNMLSSPHVITEQPLPKLTGYTQAYIPEFQLQACHTSPDLESRVINSMKSDISSGGYEKSKTIFVSLRAREIKEITMFKNIISSSANKCEEFLTGANTSNGNRIDSTSLPSFPIQQEFVTQTRKFYNFGHPNGISKSRFEKVDCLIRDVCKFVHDYQNGINSGAILEDEEDDENGGNNESKKDNYGDVEGIRKLLTEL